jgi:cell division control protein 45
MIIALENARALYEQIVKRTKSFNGKVIIFVGYDIDSLCALRILVALLRADWVKYEIVPVMNYDQLDSKIEDYKNTDARSFVMINCGGTRDMSKYWFNTVNSFICFLLDVHRPSHHNNVHSDLIAIIDDHQNNYDDCPKEEDLKDIEESDEGEDRAEDELNDIPEATVEQEEEEEMSDERPRKRLVRKTKDDDIEEEENIDSADFSAKKSKNSTEVDEKLIKRRIKMKKRMKIQNYYSGNYFGYPSSYVLYQICQSMNRDDSYSLWLLIISVTDLYLKAHINNSQYDSLYNECLKQVVTLGNTHKGKVEQSNNIRKIKTEAPNDNEMLLDKRNDYSDVAIKTSNRENKSIILDTDYNLYLYRHWNLFESFIYSNYTLANLTTWKEPGKKEVQKLFAYMGIPLDEAKQKYTCMKNEYKSLFKEKIVEISKKFDLKELLFNSFVYQYDQKTQFSASDFVHCISAILQYPFSLSELDKIGLDNNDEFGTGKTSENIDENIEDPEKKKVLEENNKAMKSHKYDHFWASYDLLSLKRTKLIKFAIDMAINFQTTLVTHGTAIIDKKAIQPCNNFRYSIINTDVNEEIKYFQHPLSLEKLALFVMDIYHNSNLCKNKIYKPFMLAVLNSINKTYLVAGVLGKARDDNHDKNQFAMRFRISAKNIGASLLLCNFDDSIVEVPKDDLLHFLEECSDD